jgi:ABC-type branched-subunit amino acid transport system substrate-binding protein
MTELSRIRNESPRKRTLPRSHQAVPIVFLCALLAGVLGCGRHEGAYLGVLGPESGDRSYYGLEGVHGAQLLVDAFAKASFTDSDVPLELVHYDTGGDIGRFEELFRRLAETDGAAAVIVTDPDAETVRLAARLADELGIAVFFTSDLEGASSEVGSSYAYDLTVGNRLLVPEAVAVAVEWSRMDTLALVTGDGDIYRLYRDDFLRALDASGVEYYDLELSLSGYDYDSAAYRILADGVSGVIVNGTTDDLLNVLKACAELTYNPPFVALSTAKPRRLELPEYYVLDQGYFVGGFSSESPNAKTTAFVESFRNNIGHVPGPVAAAGYDAARIVLRALVESNSAEAGAVARVVAGFGTHSGVAGDYTLGTPPDWVFVERTVPAATGINVELAATPPPLPLPVNEAVPETEQPAESVESAPAEQPVETE